MQNEPERLGANDLWTIRKVPEAEDLEAAKKRLADPPLNTPIPEPLYSCAELHCAEEQSMTADLLYWGGDGWYCDECLLDLGLIGGESLAYFLKRKEVTKDDLC